MPIGLNEPTVFLESFARSGSRLLEELRSIAAQPLPDKSLKQFPIREAAAMLGFTPQYIRRLETGGSARIPPLGVPPKDGRGQRSYNLERINHYRDRLGIRRLRPPGSRAIRCAVSFFKGGSAKTTTAAHLAHRCALDGLRVLLIDLDPQASLTMLHGILPDIDIQREDTLADVLIYDPSDIHSVIRKTYFPGLWLIPANLSLQDAEVKLLDHRENQEEFLDLLAFQRLDYGLQKIEGDFDVIVMDCPPNLGSLTLNVVAAANAMLLPIPPRTVDFGSAVLYAQTMSALKRDPRFSQPLDFFRVLLTLHSGSGEAKNTEAALRMLLKEYVLEHIMPVSVEIERAAADLGTVYETEQPKGSYEAYQRALTHLNALNGEIISLFREVWSRQVEAVETADASLISTAACGVSHE
ncbi:MAG: AAA family ATPase [Candidatus Competibacter sp.]